MLLFLKFVIFLSLNFACECSNPAITPIDHFDAKTDATILCNAVKSSDSFDSDSVIKILTSRSFKQRREIMSSFAAVCSGKYFLPLFRKTHDEDGLYYKVIHTLLIPLDEYYASEIYRESSTEVISSNAILDILTTSSDKEIEDIKKAHSRLRPHCSSLTVIVENPYRTKDVELDFTVELLKTTRTNYEKAYEKPFNVTDIARWFHTVGYLKNALDRKRGDERQTAKTFRSCSYKELLAIMMKYKEMYHQDFVNAIKGRGFADDVERGILTVIRVIKSTPLYFAERLYDSLRGSLGPDNQAIIRIIVGRSEIDLADISEEFENKYGRSLVSVIGSKDEDKNYLRTLQSIVSAGNNSILKSIKRGTNFIKKIKINF